MFKAISGLEKRRNIQPVGNIELMRQIEGRHDRDGALAFSDQQADRLIGVDVLQDLCSQHQLPPRGRRLGVEIAEIDLPG